MKALLLAAAATLSVSLAIAPASAKQPDHQTTQAKKPDASSAHCPPRHHAAGHGHHMAAHGHRHHHWHKAWQPPADNMYQEEAAPPPPPPPPPEPMPYSRWIDGYGRHYLAHPSEGAPPPCPCPPNMHGSVPPECRFPVWKGYNGHDGLQNGY